MKVVNIKLIDGKRTPLIEEVPDDWRRCSVTGEYRPYEEFCDSAGNYARTNALEAYNMPFVEMQRTKAQIQTLIDDSTEYNSLCSELHKEKLREEFIQHSLTIKQLILKLQEYDQDKLVTITCDRDAAGFDFQEDEYLGVKFLSLNDIDVGY